MRTAAAASRYRINNFFAAGLLCLLPASADAQESPEASGGPPFINAKAVKAWLADGRKITFLDVREPDEFAAGHLPNAINIPTAQVASLTDELPRNNPIVVYCIHSAHRAPMAAKQLRTLGFDNAFVLEGGVVAWHAGGLRIYARSRTQVPAILLKTERCQPSP